MNRTVAPATRRLWCLLALLVLAAPQPLSVSAASRTLPPPRTLGEWTERARLAESRLGESWSVMIEDLATSRPVFHYQPNRRLIPASNRKLVTFGLALEKMGPDFRFITEFGLNQPFDGSRAHYHGDLVLRSNGDPSLTPAFLGNQSNPADLLRAWCRAAAQQGIAYVHGNLLLDASAFGADQNIYPAAWDESHRTYSYAPVPSALAFCQNLLRVTVQPASRAGQPGRLSLFPSGMGVRLVNETRTTTSGTSAVSARFNDPAGDLVVSGRILAGHGSQVLMVPLPHPLTYLSELCRAALENAGVEVVGQVVIATDPAAVDGLPPLVRQLGAHESPPLNQLLGAMMRQSDNFIAEQIWRAAAARVSGRGDAGTARQTEQRWLKDHGLSWIEPGWDGSGLSRKNEISANEMMLITKEIYQSAYGPILIDCLPVSGQSGTLRHRQFGKTEGRVVAKTGTLSGVSALTGFIRDKNGQPRLVFSAIGNAKNETNGRLAMRVNHLVDILIRQMDAGELPYAPAVAPDLPPLPDLPADWDEELPPDAAPDAIANPIVMGN